MAVRQETADRVLVVTIDNPQTRNAFDKQTGEALQDIFEQISIREPLPLAQQGSRDPDIGPGGRYRPQVVVLRSRGEVFCAGAHLGEMKELGEADYQTNLAAAMEMGGMFRTIRNCPAPVIARVQGPALGGGVGLVAACDIVVASARARFAFSEVRLGLVPGVISPLIIDRIGQAAARSYFLTGETIDAAEALRLGLVDRLAPGDDPQQLDALVSRTVQSLLAGGAAALGLCKSLLEGVQSLGFSRSGEVTARLIAQARTQPEAQAALKAFLAKEPSPWSAADAWSLPDDLLEGNP